MGKGDVRNGSRLVMLLPEVAIQGCEGGWVGLEEEG
jgi:hypothetical protein